MFLSLPSRSLSCWLKACSLYGSSPGFSCFPARYAFSSKPPISWLCCSAGAAWVTCRPQKDASFERLHIYYYFTPSLNPCFLPSANPFLFLCISFLLFVLSCMSFLPSFFTFSLTFLCCSFFPSFFASFCLSLYFVPLSFLRISVLMCFLLSFHFSLFVHIFSSYFPSSYIFLSPFFLSFHFSFFVLLSLSFLNSLCHSSLIFFSIFNRFKSVKLPRTGDMIEQQSETFSQYSQQSQYF